MNAAIENVVSERNYLSSEQDLSDVNYYLKKTFVEDTEPTVKIIEKGVIWPVGFGHVEGVFANNEEYSGIEVIDKSVVFIGSFDVSQYGQVLIDQLSRLWCKDYLGYEFAFAASGRYNPKFLHRFLKLLGIPEERIIMVARPTCFSRVYMPSLSFKHDKFILPVFGTIYERMFHNMKIIGNTISYEKVYLTRTRLKRKKEIGEKRFEHFFKANGYVPVSLELLPIEEQASIIRNATYIASIEGTHAHNIVWRDFQSSCQGNQIILRKQSEFIPRQMMLNQLWKIKTIYIDVFAEPYRGFPISHDRGPFLLKWTEQIDRFARDNDMVIPPECRENGWKDVVKYSVLCVFFWGKHSLKRIIKWF